MPTEKELMLKQADAETTYQKKLTAGTNITIDPVTNVISSAGGGSTVQYTDNTPNGESVGILAINGQSHPVRIPRLAEGTGITINKDITTNVYTISLSGGGGGTTKTYMGETNPDELVGEDGDLYFKYHKIETDIPTELTLPSLPDDATVPFPITNFNSYDSFTFYYTDLNREPHSRTVNTGDLVISDSPADEYPNSNIYMGNSYCFVQATRSTNGEGLVLRVCGNCLYKLEANVTEVDLGIDKSYAKVEDTWLPSGEQVEANPEETSETPLTKIKIDGVTYYIAAGGSAEIVPLTKAEWDALPASKYTDDILYLITDSFTTETIITPNPEGEATDTLTKLQIDETIYSLAGGSGAAAVEKTQSEYNALTPAQKENGSIYMVSPDADTIVELTEAQTDDTRVTASSYGYDSNFQQYHRPWCAFNRVSPTTWSYPTPGVTNETAWVPNIGTDGSNSWIRYEFDKAENMTSMKILAFADYSSSTTKSMIIEGSNDGETWDNILAEGSSFTLTATLHENYENEVDLDPTNAYKYVRLRSLEPMGASYQPSVYIDEIYVYGYGAIDDVHKIYYMGTEYANTNGGSGGGGDAYEETVLWTGSETTNKWVEPIVLNDIDVDAYDALAIQVNVSQHIVSTEQIPIGDASASSIIGVNGFLNTNGENVVGIWLNKGNNLLRIFTATNVTIVVTKVVGIKYGSGGGSSIIPNPEEEPTDTLNSVKIDGTVYNIESSSEGEGVEIYSEDEYIVGSLNVNGVKKKIYQKTFVLNNITVTQSSGYSYDITSLGIEDVVESPRGFVKITNSDRRSIPFNLLSGYGFTATVKPNQILLERAGNNITISQAVITIRYTKTVETDAPAWGGSVNNYYANFIDTDNVIQTFTQISDTSEHTYIATEDCIVVYYVASQGDTYIKINNVLVGGNYSQNISALCNYIAVKKGQTFSFQQSYAGSSSSGYTVYGISYGSGGSSSGSSVHYSTTEQVIGTWIDGKPLYQKTYENLNIGTIQNYTLTLSDLQNIEYFRVVPEGSQISALVPFPYIHYGTENLVGYFTDVTNGVPSLEIRKGSTASFSNLQFLTIQYTKTTD